jgi:DNA-binding NtrC family response regulator
MSDKRSKSAEVDSGAGVKGREEAMAESVPEHLWLQPEKEGNYSLRSLRAQAEIYAVTRALEEAGWNRKRAAQLLRISYRGLLYKISCHKITRTVTKRGAPETENVAGSLVP